MNIIFTTEPYETLREAQAEIELSIASYQRRHDLPLGIEDIKSIQVITTERGRADQPKSTLYSIVALVDPGSAAMELGKEYPRTMGD